MKNRCDTGPWNRNTHYHPVLLALGPAERALDVGCGTGLLTRQLAPLCRNVVGLDLHGPSLDEACASTDAAKVTYEQGDVLTHPFEQESFDLIVSVAAIHHFDASAGLQRFAWLLKPGGRLGIIGIPASRYPRDLAREALANTATFVYQMRHRRTVWDHGAPMVWPPPLTDREMKNLSADILAGSTFRRHLHRRYSLTWNKPG